MDPGDDFSEDHGWNDEFALRQERQRKIESRKHFNRDKWDNKEKRRRKHPEREPRRPRTWDDDGPEEY